MIRSVIDSVNPDIYCYDTGLSFGLEIGCEILEQVNRDESYFSLRQNYNNFNSLQAMAELGKQIGSAKVRELMRRQRQVKEYYPNQTTIQFKQYFFDEGFAQKLRDQLPNYLKISDTEPDFMLQVSDSGEFLATHKGHHRTCSLFMLLESDGQETHWYRDSEPFEVIDPLRIPDLDKIEHAVTAVMQPHRWYLFNHYEWHSVHKFVQGGRRVSIGVDFHSITAPQLLEIIQANH